MVVFDASTLILLAKTGLLAVFASDYKGRILIPEKIMSEVSAKRSEEALVISEFVKEGRFEIQKSGDKKLVDKLMEDFNIDRGEAEALQLALKENAVAVATDDRNAIKAAKMLKIDFITALAFLIRAFEKKLLTPDEASCKLWKLKAVGRYGHEIIDDAASRIRKE